MEPYEIRLLALDGTTTFFYVAQCASDSDAVRFLGRVNTLDYARYEIWTGMRKVDEGPRIEQVAKQA
jgi:hypothetical protein